MKFKHLLFIIFLFIIFLGYTIISYSSQVSTGLQNNIFRLHILANSDSESDQNLKLALRDEIISYIEEISKNSSNKTDTISIIQEHLSEIENLAQNFINEQGYSYVVSTQVGNFYFPTKYYGNISLPAGDYDALQITIGEAKGQNWWCSLFPPLCFIDISSGYLDEEDSQTLEENLSEEEFLLISKNSLDIKLKFKILEFFNKEI